MDFFSVPTIRFSVLYCFFVISHDRRRILHFNVTPHPTSHWVVQQLREAFPYGSAPRFLIFDARFYRLTCTIPRKRPRARLASAPAAPTAHSRIAEVLPACRHSHTAMSRSSHSRTGTHAKRKLFKEARAWLPPLSATIINSTIRTPESSTA
jgi:hypothetical protein